MPKPKKKKSDLPACILTRGRDASAVKKMVEDHLAGKSVDVNKGVISVDAWNKMKDDYKGSDSPAALPFIYQPAVVQIAKEQGREFLKRGQKSKSKKPRDWDKAAYGEYEPGGRIESFRENHTKDIRSRIEDPDKNMIEVGKFSYVMGIWCINSARSGNYKANIQAVKQVNFKGMKEVDNLVGQMNTEIEVEQLEAGSGESAGAEIVWMPNQRVVWGHLQKGGKVLTHDQIRKLENATGTKFVPLKKPIIGKGCSQTEWWKIAKREMEKDRTGGEEQSYMDRYIEKSEKKEKDPKVLGWNNVFTQLRIDPGATNCFGFRSLACGMPLYRHFGGSDSTKAELIGIAIGRRLVDDLSETKHVVKRRKPKVEPKKKSKPKKSRSRSKKKKVKEAVTQVEAPPVADDAPPLKLVEAEEKVAAE